MTSIHRFQRLYYSLDIVQENIVIATSGAGFISVSMYVYDLLVNLDYTGFTAA